MAHAGSVGTDISGIGEIGGSYLSSLTPKFLIGIFNRENDEELDLEKIARATKACKIDFGFCAVVSNPVASIHVDVDGKPIATYNTTQADVMAWCAAQKRRPQSFTMAEANIEAESSDELQSLIDKLPGLAKSIDWAAPADDGRATTAEWVGSVKWALPAASPSTVAGVTAIASYLIARGYSMSYEACENDIGDDCGTIIMFFFGSTGTGCSEGFDSSNDWASAIGTLDHECASSLVNMGLLRRNPKAMESCGSKRPQEEVADLLCYELNYHAILLQHLLSIRDFSSTGAEVELQKTSIAILEEVATI
ncbi:uncharacterized protein BDZ83DRAFT_758290 [Colletotrichum acutatum]|uniref:Uncharacterized protein n=1 Tax=Glomerella acutata TaxID=27357 RepID=A0AAD8XBK9_GLOAC|nr:uncharacterized protein BDZ83DRAFT_758290 [Colletotrichum acutatum]KAK1707137.1 hypothetical protein BDZ83DRAFT_758290 [Colletotrichum acutatum]